MVTRFAASLPTDISPQPKEARPFEGYLMRVAVGVHHAQHHVVRVDGGPVASPRQQLVAPTHHRAVA